jgi:uncharacterized protein (UPF0333 family)
MLKERLERMNNKGQEGITLGTLLLIVLGVVVVVIIIVGATQGFGTFFDLFNQAPGKSLEVAVQSCALAAQNSLKTDYCVDLKKVEINGEEQYVTCKWLGDNNYLEDKISDCKPLVLDEKAFCVNEKLKKDVKVNGVACNVKCGDIGGEWKQDSDSCDGEDISSKVQDRSDVADNSNAVCCLASS